MFRFQCEGAGRDGRRSQPPHGHCQRSWDIRFRRSSSKAGRLSCGGPLGGTVEARAPSTRTMHSFAAATFSPLRRTHSRAWSIGVLPCGTIVEPERGGAGCATEARGRRRTSRWADADAENAISARHVHHVTHRDLTGTSFEAKPRKCRAQGPWMPSISPGWAGMRATGAGLRRVSWNTPKNVHSFIGSSMRQEKWRGDRTSVPRSSWPP